jgi:hypothetical protein
MNKKVPVLLVLVALFVASLACSLVTGGSAEMSLENLRMAFDEDGNSPTTEFSASDIFMLWVTYKTRLLELWLRPSGWRCKLKAMIPANLSMSSPSPILRMRALPGRSISSCRMMLAGRLVNTRRIFI